MPLPVRLVFMQNMYFMLECVSWVASNSTAIFLRIPYEIKDYLLMEILLSKQVTVTF